MKSTAAELRVTFYGSAGSPVDATGTPTVTITRDDGTDVVTDETTTKVAATTGIYSYTLTPTDTADLDLLTAAWTGVVEATSQTFYTEAEIVGGFVCSLAHIDEALGKGGTPSNYTLDTKHAARNVATESFEQEAGVAFTPRYARRLFDGPGGTDLLLPTPQANTVRAVTVDDTALTLGELAVLGLYESGLLYNPSGWTCGRRNVEVVWEHGHRSTPADVARAVTLLAAHMLADGPWDDRGYGVTDEGGAVRLLTAGISGASYSIPECEAALARYRYPVVA